MSQPVRALAPLPFELVYDDGEPLDSPWHRVQMILALDLIPQAMREQGRTDFYVGGNNFVYYSVEQAREVALEEDGLSRLRPSWPDCAPCLESATQAEIVHPY